ncbi:hypothetical protein EDB85DRAFT_2165216 [Lactarius pseudohatsudake]|nr:hypothetical protein EDB85DRAFT_2165216 [Lactarius pseudohatsudake]
MSSPPYTLWASADDWKPGFVMLGSNVSAIPTAPPRSEVIIGADGLWGVHEWTVYPQFHHPEFPYLAWIPLHSSNTSFPSNIITRSIDKSMWQAYPNKSNIHSVRRDVLDELMVKWKSTKAALEDPFSTISFDFSSVRCPRQAYNRAFEALSRLENPKGFEAWRDFVEVFRNLQRSLLELHAFLDWWEDNRAGNKFRSPIRAPTRGSIFEDVRLYANYARQSVGALLLIHKSIFSLDPTKEVALSPRKLCKTQPMSLHAPLHSLHLWYYPPLVHDVVTELETAARGYAERLDTFNPTMGFKRKMEKSKNKVNDEALRMAKKAKTDSASEPNSQELRRLTDAGATPYWFPKIQEVWKHAVGHVSHLGLASQESSRRFAFPPIHLFWGGELPNQRVYYHHYLLLFNEIKNRPERDLPALTTHEWRSILGNSYWKKQWPKHDGNSSSTFDPNVFWKYGGSLLFGNERSADVAAGRYNPTSRLSCHCDVQLATADETDIRQVVLYYLNSFHVYEEIREMERLQFPTTFEKQWRSLRLEVNHIVEMWDPSGGVVNTNFFCDTEVWILWVRAVRDVVAGWGGFDQWDWGTFSKVRTMEISNLSRLDFQKFTVRLLAFFIHSFVTRLGYYPSALLHPPTLTTHSCIRHLKKFGYGLITLPVSVE